MSNLHAPIVTIIDKPCGTGKTSRLIKSFQRDRQYLVVVPLLSEVERVIEQAEVPFDQPVKGPDGKLGSIYDLLVQGRNIVTTHALYDDLASAAHMGFLDGYDIIVDEVLDVVRAEEDKAARGFHRVCVDGGWATVDGDGRCAPTPKWQAEVKTVDGFLSSSLYAKAKSGCLYLVDDVFLLWAFPPSLLTAGRSMTFLTYMAEGSMLLPYLRRRGIAFDHQQDVLEDFTFRIKARSLITVCTIGSLERYKWSYTAQTHTTGKKDRDKKVAGHLANFRNRSIKDVPLNDVMVTCSQSNWTDKKSRGSKKPRSAGFATGSKLFEGTQWVANTTRGTNDYAHCTHAIYLWDQHPNHYVTRWLGVGGSTEFADQYATTELVQWLYRTQVRKGKPVTLYAPSPRMRRLLTAWLNAEDILGFANEDQRKAA